MRRSHDGADGGRCAGKAEDLIEMRFEMWTVAAQVRCIDAAHSENGWRRLGANCLEQNREVGDVGHDPETDFLCFCVDAKLGRFGGSKGHKDERKLTML